MGEVCAVPLEQIGEHYRWYRLGSPKAEEEMVRSLRRWGQLAPITVSIREGLAETLQAAGGGASHAGDDESVGAAARCG